MPSDGLTQTLELLRIYRPQVLITDILMDKRQPTLTQHKDTVKRETIAGDLCLE